MRNEDKPFTRYDMEKDTRIIEWDNKLPPDDPQWRKEVLWLSRGGKYYLQYLSNTSNEIIKRINYKLAVAWVEENIDKKTST